MSKTKKMQMTFGELVETVYKTAEQFPTVAPHDVARELSDWTARGLVTFRKPREVRHLIQEIN